MNGQKLFIIDSPENKTDMFRFDGDELSCEKCGMIKQFDRINSDYIPPKKSRDMSHTYDGYTIVSDRFKQVSEAFNRDLLRFEMLPRAAGYHVLFVRDVLKITRPPELKFEGFCDACRRYVSVYGLSCVSAVLPVNNIEDGFYASDIKLGIKNLMFPLLFATQSAKEAVKRAKLTGIYFEEMRVVNQMAESNSTRQS